MRRSGRDRPIGCELAKTACDQTACAASCEENEQILNVYALLEEELTNSGQEHLDASGDDENIMPVPENAEPLRQALQRTGAQTKRRVVVLDVNGYRSLAVVRFDNAYGERYFPFCWVRSANGEGWKARSVPAPGRSLTD
jgi:hypothetical protein